MNKKILFLVLVIMLVPTSVFANSNFTDIKDHWAEHDIRAIYQEGIMKGTMSDVFSPDENVTRAQLAVILDRTFNFNYNHLRFIKEPKISDFYDDVSDGLWYSGAILDVSYNSIFNIKGRDFGPNEEVARIEVAEAIVNSFKAKNLSVSTTQIWPDFKDTNNLSKEQLSALAFTFNTGIMKGRSDSEFKPFAPITRAELAVVLNRTLETMALAEKTNKTTLNEEEGELLGVNVLKNLSGDLEEAISLVHNHRGYGIIKEQGDEAIIYVGSGEKPTGGYNIEVTSVKDVAGTTVITVKETSPSKDKMLIQMISYPYTVIKVSNITDDIKVINTNGELFENINEGDI
ncbi:MAG: protease complex subunit PrcB family protein [Firmicutes bacterium]|nr:protease complex subunit PrcB family protein [Bacillota bacterium]